MQENHVKAVLVTGAGDRLGLALAQALAQRGYKIVLHANASFKKAEAEAAASRIAKIERK